MEYADLVSKILGHKAVIFVPWNHRENTKYESTIENAFRSKFEVQSYKSFSDLNATLSWFDMAYRAERGEDTGIPPISIPLAVHCTHVCTKEDKHGDLYIPIVPEINQLDAPVVPRVMLNPMSTESRNALNIPENAILVAYYGSISTPDPIVLETAQKLVDTESEHNVWLVFINSQIICTTNRIITLSHESDNNTKLTIVNAADAVIYTPQLGILMDKSPDDLAKGKTPLFTKTDGDPQTPLEYKSSADLYTLLRNLGHTSRNSYLIDSKSVADRFQKHIIDPLTTNKRIDTINTDNYTYTIGEGWLAPTSLGSTTNGWQSVPLPTGHSILINAPPSSEKMISSAVQYCVNANVPVAIVVEENPSSNQLSPAFIEAIMSERVCLYHGCPNISDYLRPPEENRAGHYIPLPLDTSSSNTHIDIKEAQTILQLTSPEGMTSALSRLEQLCKLTVNLDRRPDRYEEHEKRCREAQLYNVQRIPAADGKDYPLDHPLVRKMFTLTVNFVGDGRNPSGIIGCALSHYWIWERAAKSNEPILAMEDDITFASGATQRLAWLLQILDTVDWDVVFIGYHKHEKNAMAHGVPEDHLEKICRKLDIVPFNVMTQFGTPDDASGLHGGGTFGYLVSPKGAQKMMDVVEKWTIAWPVDYFILDCGLHHNLNILTCAHPLVYSPKFGVDTESSDIQQTIIPCNQLS